MGTATQLSFAPLAASLAASGHRIVKAEPSSTTLSTAIVPPIASISSFAIARPRPAPPDLAAARWASTPGRDGVGPDELPVDRFAQAGSLRDRDAAVGVERVDRFGQPGRF